MSERETRLSIPNWILWLEVRIPTLKRTHNRFWLKQAMEACVEDNSTNIIDINSKPYPNTVFPKRATDNKGNQEEFSVDVITCDKSGLLNIGYYNFDSELWAFHTDTLTDYYESGTLKDFVWMYKPESLKTS